jgi:ABC-type glycerol-3-phosphate transport system substrate-binding protein
MNVKRFTALASTTLVTAGLVATALAQGKTELSVLWMTGGTGDQPLLERYAKLYEAANPNVSVQLTFVPLPQLAQKLQLMVAGKTPPDVSRITTSTIADFAPLAADLKGTINPKDFMASQLPYVQSGKRLIGAPLGRGALPGGRTLHQQRRQKIRRGQPRRIAGLHLLPRSV